MYVYRTVVAYSSSAIADRFSPHFFKLIRNHVEFFIKARSPSRAPIEKCSMGYQLETDNRSKAINPASTAIREAPAASALFGELIVRIQREFDAMALERIKPTL